VGSLADGQHRGGDEKNSVLKIHPAKDAGYFAVAAVAKDNLALGLGVIADTANLLEVSRQLSTDTAVAASALILKAEIVCNDRSEYKRRVESRMAIFPGLLFPIGTKQRLANTPMNTRAPDAGFRSTFNRRLRFPDYG